MADLGTFIWNNKTANLMYGVEGDKYSISHLDDPGEPGHEFLASLDVGNEIVLQDGKKGIKMVVVQLNIGGPYIRCAAKAL